MKEQIISFIEAIRTFLELRAESDDDEKTSDFSVVLFLIFCAVLVITMYSVYILVLTGIWNYIIAPVFNLPDMTFLKIALLYLFIQLFTW